MEGEECSVASSVMHSLTTSERDVEMRTDHSCSAPQTPLLLLLLLDAAVEVEVEVEVEESEAGRQRITRPTAVMTAGEAVVGCRAGVSRCLKNLLAVREEREAGRSSANHVQIAPRSFASTASAAEGAAAEGAGADAVADAAATFCCGCCVVVVRHAHKRSNISYGIVRPQPRRRKEMNARRVCRPSEREDEGGQAAAAAPAAVPIADGADDDGDDGDDGSGGGAVT